MKNVASLGRRGNADAVVSAERDSPVADQFRVVLGDAVHTGDERWRYRCAGQAPRCALFPGSVEEVSAAVRVAAETDLALVPCGNGTHLDVGFMPRRYDAALATRRLDRVLGHDAGDMTATVESGVTLARLNAILAEQGQWLPFDPPRADEMTIGGLIAADRNGPLRLACGRVRDRLIGLRAVTANGEVLRGGGRVVKNVAGYDVTKLFAGSFGTLGVIVEATFKVAPRPQLERLFLWPASSIDEATDRAAAVLGSPAAPALLESLNGAAAEALAIGEEPVLVIGCAGSEAEVAAAERCVRGLEGGQALRACTPERGRAILRAVREFAPANDDERLIARVSALPAALPALLKRIETEAIGRGLAVEIAAHAGTGVAWCVVGETPAGLPVELFAEWVRIHTRELGGWIVFEGIPAALRDRLDPWGFSGPALSFMAEVKRVLDPRGIFSPGRFVGGI